MMTSSAQEEQPSLIHIAKSARLYTVRKGIAVVGECKRVLF